jgi:phage tail-like protein
VENKLSKEGKEFMQKMPSRLKWMDVTLNRGITDNRDIWFWRQLVVDGDIKGARRNCSILMYDRNDNVAARWDFVNAWPSKVSFRYVKADNNYFAIEEMVIVHEGMKRVK